MKSPFKFPDSYIKDNPEIFWLTEKERHIPVSLKKSLI